MQEMAFSCLTSSPTNVGLSCRYVVSLLLLMVGQPCASGMEINAAAFLLLTAPAPRGNLSINNLLSNAERIHHGQISSPHSYVLLGDDVYAATSNGLVVNVAPCRPVILANLRPRGCRTLKECGHLISIRLNPENLLLVLDAYKGLFEVHPVTGVIRHLYDSRTLVNGRPSVYLNDLVIMKDGTIIMSDSSARFNYDHEFWIRFEARPDGRLIGFSPVNGQTKEVLSGLAYPTGLEITNNGQALLVSEASRARILRLELSKDKFFQRSYVNINLAGMPEHIRKSGRGTYWVGLSYPRYRGETSILDQYSNMPGTRNFLAARRNLNELQLMYKTRGLAVELDEIGKVLRSIHDPSGLKVGEVLEVTENSGLLYVGTRLQQATVRVIGAPSELTVDSLVQVLRGRCKVAEDEIQTTKDSIQKQLKGNQTNESQKSTAKIQQYTSPPFQTTSTVTESTVTISSVTEKPRQHVDLQSLSLGLSLLHRALFNTTVYSKDSPSTEPPLTQIVRQNVTFHPQGKSPHPPKELIHVTEDSVTFDNRQINSPNDSSTIIPSQERIQPPQDAQNNIPSQKTDMMSSTQLSTRLSTSPTQPHIIHGSNERHSINNFVLGKNTKETLTVYSPGQYESERSYADVPIELTHQPAYKQTQASALRASSTSEPAIQQSAGHQQETVNFGSAMESVPQQNSLTDTNEIGGFMGFLGNSDVQNDAKNQVTQNPYAFAVPDPGLYGQIEPVLDANSGSKHQFLPGMESDVNYEQLNLPNKTPNKVEQMPINGTQTVPSNSSHQESVNSFKTGAPKRLDMNVQDISIKDATEIQNMQMFHPTDRPEQFPELQNQAGTKAMSSFQDKASMLNHETQQFDINSQDPNQGASYISAQDSQIQIPQMPSQQNALDTNIFGRGQLRSSTFQDQASVLNRESQQLHTISQNLNQGASYTSTQGDHIQTQVPHVWTQTQQDTNIFGRGQSRSSTSGSAMSGKTQSSHFSSDVQVEGFDPGAPLNQGSSVGNIYDHMGQH